MVNSRRMLLIGIIVVGVILLGVGVTFLTGSVNDPYKKTCNTFLTAVMNQETTHSYGMLSASARKLETAQSWSEKVVSLEYIYKGGKLQFNQKLNANDTNDPDVKNTGPDVFELDYTLVHPAATSSIKCMAVKDNGKTVIDGFSTAEKASSESGTQ